MLWTVLVGFLALSLVVQFFLPMAARQSEAAASPQFVILTVAQWLTIVVGSLAILWAKTWKARLGLMGSVVLVYVLAAWAAGWSDCPPGYGHGAV